MLWFGFRPCGLPVLVRVTQLIFQCWQRLTSTVRDPRGRLAGTGGGGGARQGGAQRRMGVRGPPEAAQHGLPLPLGGGNPELQLN